MQKIDGNVKLTAILVFALIAVAALLLQSCTGTKLLKEPIPVIADEPLAHSADEFIEASLNWVVVRDGPGTWAENADWDEYWITVSNRSPHSIDVTGISIIDSLETRIDSSSKRSDLVRNSKKSVKRYKELDIEVTAGFGAIALLSASAVSGAAGIAAINTLGVLSSGAGMVAVATVFAVPALAIAGFYRGINDQNVSKAIKARHTKLPLTLMKGETRLLHIFYPLAPSPLRLEIHYVTNERDKILHVDTSEALQGLHFAVEGY